jgi:hypothetical protein
LVKNCEWNVAVAAGNRVRLRLLRLDDLDGSATGGGGRGTTTCEQLPRNYLDVFDGSPSFSGIKSIKNR